MRIIRDAALFVAATLVLGTVFNLAPGRHVEWWGHGIEPPAAGVESGDTTAATKPEEKP